MNEKKKKITAEALPPNALEVIPDSVLQFSLTRSATSLKNERAVMTLCHSGRTNEAIAFKVKTTQPRRYLVRPNQGIIMPTRKENVTILIVDKDRQILLDKYKNHGKSALVNSKDKFLVQSCIVDIEFAQRFFYLGESSDLFTESGMKTSKETTEALTDMWSKTAGESSSLIYNRKLQVQHVICSSFFTSSNAVVSTETNENFKKSESNFNHPINSAISGNITRCKSDDLLPPSSNINNELDFLKDDTKKKKSDLCKVTVTSSTVNKNDKNANTCGPTLVEASNVKSGIPYHRMIVIATFFFFIGIKASNIQKFTEVLAKIPAFGSFLGVDRKEGIGQEL